MAVKRMFSNKVLDTDAFLEMPLSAQALYFHLNLRADDDGFIGNPKRIQSYVGASEDDLKLLILKRFLIAFDDGVMVIKHWRMHNTIQRDRYTPTDYIEDLAMLGIKDNKAYTLDVSNLETKCIQNVSTDIDIDKDKDIDIDIGLGKGKDKKKAPVYFPDDEALNKAFTDYVAMRKAIKAPMTDKAVELAISKLNKLSGGDNDVAIEILNQSVLNSWKGLFELKDKVKTKEPNVVDEWLNS